MLVTTIPSALEGGARLFHQTRAEAFEIENGEVKALLCAPIRINGQKVSDRTMRVTARHYVVAGGAINSPALLKRSKAPDPHGLLGTRTFLHPVAFSSAVFDHKIEGWAGAPQSIYSDHFVHDVPLDGPIGYKLEATPMHPGLTSILLGGHGKDLAERFAQYPHTQMMLALLRDGFHPESQGGTVYLNLDGSPLLHYPLNDYVLEGFRQALLSMAEVQFAAGARKVLPLHEQGQHYESWAQARQAILGFDMKPYLVGGGSAHVMGGCRMGGNERLGVVRLMGCTGRSRTSPCTTAHSFRPVSAPTRSSRSTARSTAWPRSWLSASAAKRCRSPDPRPRGAPKTKPRQGGVLSSRCQAR